MAVKNRVDKVGLTFTVHSEARGIKLINYHFLIYGETFYVGLTMRKPLLAEDKTHLRKK